MPLECYMLRSQLTKNEDDARIVLSLLESVGRDGAQSQRRLAAELGIALGLVNAYLKRAIGKGLVKVRHVPARRYAYYLTPQGFAEKSRLTMNFLSSSFSFFRQAKADCLELFADARQRGFLRVALAGRSDLAEIAIICAIECDVEIVAVVDPTCPPGRFVGAPLLTTFDDIDAAFDAVVVTDIMNPRQSWDLLTARFGVDRVWVPSFLRAVIGAEDLPS